MARPTLLNLETALWVGRTGSFSGAARKLNASPSAIALRMRELEASLNVRIFVRRGQQMLPTAEGRDFLERVEPLMLGLQSLLGEVSVDAGSGGAIRIGAGHVAVTWMARVLGSLARDAMSFRYEITIERVPTLILLLEQETLDLGLLPTPFQHPKFECTLLGKEPMLWLMASDRVERFGKYPKASVTLPELLDRGPLWFPHKASPYFQRQEDVLRAHGAHLRNVNVCTDILRLGDLVASTGGLGYLPGTLARARVACDELCPVPGLDPGVAELYAVRRRSDHRPMLKRLIELAQKESGLLAATQPG